MLLLTLALALTAAPAFAEESAAEPCSRGLRVDLSFPHWFADEYRTAEQARSASLGVGVHPGTKWMELYARWEWMHLAVDPSHPDHEAMDGLWVDFTSVGLALTREVSRGVEGMRVSASLLAVLPRLAGDLPTLGFGGGYALHYMIDLGNPGGLRLGPFFDARENTVRYRRPDGSLTEWQVEVSMNIGIAAFL